MSPSIRPFERRSAPRDLPVGPRSAPDPAPDQGSGEELAAFLASHPACSHPRLVRLADDLAPAGRGVAFVAALAPLPPLLCEMAGRVEPLPGEDVPAMLLLPFDPSRTPGVVERLLTGLRRRAGDPSAASGPMPAPVEPCRSLTILRRVHREIRSGGFWVASGGVGLGLPLALASLSDHLGAALQTLDARDLAGDARNLSGALRELFRDNLSTLGPYLHDEPTRQAVRVGGERLLEGFRIALSGIETRVFGGLREL